MKAVLYDYVAASREELLRRHLATPWELVSLPDVSDQSQVRRLAADADAFVGNVFPAGLKDAVPHMRLLHCVGAGVDGFDPALLPPGSTLCNVYEHEIPIAEYVLMSCLLLATRLRQYEATFRQGRWDGSGRHDGEFHDEIYGKTLGLVGCGHIGQAVAVRAKAFGLRVLAVARTPRSCPDVEWCRGIDALDEMLGQCDFVVIACPSTPQTRGLIGEAQLKRLKSTAFLINPARADIIEETALYKALREKWFAGAALDVWYEYPKDLTLTMHGSKLPFHELDNVILTPHLSAWTRPMVERRYRRIAENLDRFARGEPLERVVLAVPGGSNE